MKQFQSRVVGAWIVALPLAYGLVVDARRRTAHLRVDPQAEIARQLQMSISTSFVHFFLTMFASLILITMVIDWLGKLIQRLFPEREQSVKSAKARTTPAA